jgi:uncharacterized protein involved in exopolysaccharide biosynthesis
VVLGVFLGTVVGLFVGAIQPNEYVSRCDILVHLGQRESMGVEPSEKGSGSSMSAGGVIANEMSVLLGEPLFERVAQAVGPADILAPYDPASKDGSRTPGALRWYHRFQSWWNKEGPLARTGSCPDPTCDSCVRAAGAILHSRAEVDYRPQATIVTASLAAPNPDLAHRIMRAYSAEVGKYHTDVFVPEVFKQSLRVLSEQASARAEEEEKAFTQYREECGIWDADKEELEVRDEIQRIEEELFEQDLRIRELEKRREIFASRLEGEPETVERSEKPSALTHPEYLQLQEDLQFRRRDLAQLRDRFVDDSPLVRRKLDEIADLEARLSKVDAFRVFDAISIQAPNPRRDKIEEALFDLEPELEWLRDAREPLVVRLQDRKDRLSKIQGCKAELEAREHTVSVLRSEANRVAAALEKGKLIYLLNELGLPNIRVTREDLYPPRSKEGPDRQKALLAGVLLGLFAGVGTGLLRHLMRSSIGRPEEVRDLLGVPVLGVVPELHGGASAAPRVLLDLPPRP